MYILSALCMCVTLQLSILFLFRKLSRSMKRPKLWSAVAILLMAIPFSGGIYQVIETHRAHIPLSDLLSLVGSFLAALVSLGLVPVTYLIIRSREGQSGRVQEINASLEAEIVQRKKAEEQLRALSFTDELTGLFNRRGLLTMGDHQLKLARRTRRRFLLVYADLDNMKRINDKFGHIEGDAALIEAADILREVFRESDIIARIGGDEFVILAVDSDGAQSEALINRIHQRCILANLKKARPYVLAMSAGSAEFDPDQPATLEELVAQADRAMYAEKQRRQKRPPAKGA
ncbi:MAG TPA: GGDEF domain-containing protein, partial [Syntrophorhabdales bacterium]|nr:GGDEF domain-containing protein [Syntrophorhabdales bacterium]